MTLADRAHTCYMCKKVWVGQFFIVQILQYRPDRGAFVEGNQTAVTLCVDCVQSVHKVLGT